jgi:hypothetical protein
LTDQPHGRTVPGEQSRDEGLAQERAAQQAHRTQTKSGTRKGGARSASLPPSALSTGEEATPRDADRGRASTRQEQSEAAKEAGSQLPKAQPGSGSERADPAQKDLREGAVGDPPVRDFGDLEPDM